MRVFVEPVMLDRPDSVVTAFLGQHCLRDRIVKELLFRFRGGSRDLELEQKRKLHSRGPARVAEGRA